MPSTAAADADHEGEKSVVEKIGGTSTRCTRRFSGELSTAAILDVAAAAGA